MDVNQGWLWMQFLSKKLLSGMVSPDNYNLALSVTNVDFFNLKCGLPQEYRPGQPMPRQAYEVTTKITDDIKHLRKVVDIPNNGFNQYVQPAGYGAFSSMRTPQYSTKNNVALLSWRTVAILTDEDYNERTQSALVPITQKSPAGCYLEGAFGHGWEIPVSTISTVRLTFLRIPKTPVFGYTIVNDEPVYNPATSVQLDWPDTVHPDFFIALCRYVGIYINSPEIWQMLGVRQNTGQ